MAASTSVGYGKGRDMALRLRGKRSYCILRTGPTPGSYFALGPYPLAAYPEGTPGCTIRWTLVVKFVNPADWKDPQKQEELKRFYDGKAFVDGVRERLVQERLKRATEAVEKKPDDAAAHNELAWVLATSSLAGYRDGKRAV